jgi:hypothetical protein
MNILMNIDTCIKKNNFPFRTINISFFFYNEIFNMSN